MTLNPTNAEERARLVDWLRDEITKTYVKGVLVANSGGADSACVTSLCVDAIGPRRVLNVTIPIASASYAAVDATRIAEWLGVEILELPMDNTLEMFLSDSKAEEHPAWNKLSNKEQAVAKGNVKARLRTTMARFWAEVHGYLFINTCNWSETVVGYDTKGGGDADGDLCPIIQFVKWDIWELLRLRGAPQWILDKTPSPDLEAGQTDEGDLGMSYATLDIFAGTFASGGMDAVLTLSASPERDRFISLYMASMHKRLPPPSFQREGFIHST
ncbi:NAD(+) synthase [Candidatus Uhrbacteria bacterium]|nr:NAD(+) synthase [Candidatus Uhrbacteria bacterium]